MSMHGSYLPNPLKLDHCNHFLVLALWLFFASGFFLACMGSVEPLACDLLSCDHFASLRGVCLLGFWSPSDSCDGCYSSFQNVQGVIAPK